MRTAFKRSLLVLLVFGLTWAGAILYWRDSSRAPDSGDLLLYLLVLPLTILLLLWLGVFLIGMLAAAPAVAVAADAPPPAPPPPPAPLPPLGVLASALNLPFGASAAELGEALAEQKIRPALDKELVDDDGFPVMSARVEGADDPAVQDDMQAWLPDNGFPALEYNEEQWRALTLATGVVRELAGHLLAHPALAKGATVPLPTLQLLMLWQAGWHQDQRGAAALWLARQVARCGWPREHIALDPELAGDPSVATPAALVQRLARQSADGKPVLALVVACASHIGEASVARWAGQNTLLTAKQGQGRLPGEGAAALLLADPAQAALIDDKPPVQLLSAEGQREASADSAKRADAAVLRVLAEQVLARAASPAAEVKLIVADTGNRSTRVMEAMSLAGGLLPELDGDDELLQVGSASGTCGAVPFVAALAVAAQQAAKLNAPVLCLSNEDPFRRCAALVRPATVLS
ncbi:hypothetical protein HF313_21660 [Massilia atriviolacea]|uniref:Transmembrane protein n=1 Tax=Massilia atriviolacea TaxID=2495579 RepID=A0A430HF43_9BURK|nr:hypothetical protein [Massilia atriviolacea]RSZ56184.1 hypothetical protein EJB06_25095 [Massilia atriviolacea]